jgi:dUTP pyrophosphatase
MSNTTETLKVELVHPNAKLPVRSTSFAAGYDLHSPIDSLTIPPGEQVLIKTGVKVCIPQGWCGQIWPRSGLAYKNRIDRRAGLIDSDYRGEIGVILVNESKEPFIVQKGDRIAQMVLVRHGDMQVVMVESLEESERGEGGFGSTGQ